MTLKGIVLCADDYGQETSISLAIVDLIKMGRLSATSCIVTSPHWQADGLMLRDLENKIDVGLHFNLTEGEGCDSLSTIMRKACLRQLDQASIEAEFERQLHLFESVMGRLPDYIDGHQHVHQFPIIRDAILSCYQKKLRDHQVYIRLVDQPLKLKDYVLNPKKMLIQLMGTRAFKKKLKAANVAYNQSFEGVYSLNATINYAEKFTEFLKNVDAGGIIMCHPGLGVSVAQDKIYNVRKNEYEFFKSDLFLQALLSANCELIQFRDKAK